MQLASAERALGPRLRRTGERIRGTAKRDWPGLAIALAAVLGYHAYSTHDVGGCDTWSYLAQARLLRGIDVGLTGTLDPKAFPALAPLCAEVAGHKLVPGMPPGFSFLLAAGGVLGLEFWVAPLVGGLSVLLIYLASREIAGRAAGAGIAVLWATSPIVIWGATNLMSDLSATTALLLAHVLLTRGRPASSGFVIGASVGIRPTNILFLISLIKRGLSPREILRTALGTAAALAYWFLFGLGRYGLDMFRMYRTDNTKNLTFEQLGHQSQFIVTYSVVLFPVLAALAVGSVVRRPRETLPLSLWFAAFAVFYSSWRWPYDVWWWTRHVLPAFPALALLGAHAVPSLRANRFTRLPGLQTGLGVVAVVANAGANLVFAAEQGLFLHAFDHVWEEGSLDVKRSVRKNSLVGTVDYSGALRLYAGIESFNWLNPAGSALIEHALESGRRVYFLLTPREYVQDGAMASYRQRYALSPRATLPWAGYVLYDVAQKSGAPLPAGLATPNPGVALEAAHGVRGNVDVVVDGVTPPEGSAWSGAGTVVLDDVNSWLLFATDLARVEAVSVTADGNDVYRLQASDDAVTFEPIGDVAFTNEFGLRTRNVVLTKPRAMRFLRIAPVGGDGSYSVAEVKASFGSWVANVASATGVHGDVRVLTDGRALADGTVWNAPGAVILENTASEIVLDTPAVPVEALRIVADGNDPYTLEGSCDGQSWTKVGTFSPVMMSGHRSSLVGVGPDAGWCRFRLRPFDGDGSYAVSEIEVVAGRGVVLELGSASARPSLGHGWVMPAKRPPVPFLFAQHPTATIRARLESGHPYHLAITAARVPGIGRQRLSVSFNGRRLGNVELAPEPAIFGFEVAGEQVQDVNAVELSFSDGVTLEGRVPPPDRTKPVAAAIQRVAFIP